MLVPWQLALYLPGVSVTPGLGIPGGVVPDGSSIPSVLGCNDGETCP